MVKNKIRKLKEGKAPGNDGLIPQFLKNIMDEISEPLAVIFNHSLKEGMVPDDWKIANVTPIFKKGSRQDPSNYRPVSLTSHIGKLMESILKDKVVEHLKKFTVINESQHGFMTKSSCLTNLLEYLEYVTDKLGYGFACRCNIFRFSKSI
jgi:hypothetical protein